MEDYVRMPLADYKACCDALRRVLVLGGSEKIASGTLSERISSLIRRPSGTVKITANGTYNVLTVVKAEVAVPASDGGGYAAVVKTGASPTELTLTEADKAALARSADFAAANHPNVPCVVTLGSGSSAIYFTGFLNYGGSETTFGGYRTELGQVSAYGKSEFLLLDFLSGGTMCDVQVGDEWPEEKKAAYAALPASMTFYVPAG